MTTPSSSPPSSPCRSQGQDKEMQGEEEQKGRDLMKEFERIGAEALLHPLTPPGGAMGEEEQEVQEKEEGWHMDSLASDCAARGKEFKSTRRQSGVEGGCVAAAAQTSSLVWWYQPWPHYWASLAYYCMGCQKG